VKIPKQSVRFFSGAYFVERGESFKKIIVAFGGEVLSWLLEFVCFLNQSTYKTSLNNGLKKKIGEK